MYLEEGKALFHEPLPVARTATGDFWVTGLLWEQPLEFAGNTGYLDQDSSMSMLSDTLLLELKRQSDDRDELHSGTSVCIFHLVDRRGKMEKSPSLLAEQPTYYKKR